MPLIRHREKIIFFVHIPKAGGTSVEDAMTQAGAVVALRYGSRFNGFMKTTFQHLNNDIYRAVIPSNFYDYAFAITRHPIPRLVSEYYYRIKRGDTPKSFDHWVNKALDSHAKNPYALDNHVRPQVDFVDPDIETFRIEDGLTPALKTAAWHLGLTLPETNLQSNRTSHKIPVTWTHQTRARVCAFYAEDYAAFGYDQNAVFPEVSEVVDNEVTIAEKKTWLSRLRSF